MGDSAPTYLARDFVETRGGLLFAVVATGIEAGRILGFLRYIRDGQTLHKLETAAAVDWLRREQADYLYHSPARDVVVHGVPASHVVRHYQPAARLAEILTQPARDVLEDKVRRLTDLIDSPGATPAWLGVTGSLLVAAHRAASDIDLVCYGRERFALARTRLRKALAEGQLSPLSDRLWHDAYARRGCSLSLEEYLWHEGRKFNKFACDGTKVDISCVLPEPPPVLARCRKVRRATVRAVVTDDTFAFDYPARYPIAHDTLSEILCFTPTYAGQALRGETVEAAGWVEQADDGAQRLTIGTSRESPGEYIKVVRT